VLGLQKFLRDKLRTWANNCSCVEDIWTNFKDIVFKGIERFVPHKILKANPDPEYYNKKVKRLKVKFRKAYNRRKLGEHYKADLKGLFNKIVDSEKKSTGNFLELCFTKRR
jgi:hypothetical protein